MLSDNLTEARNDHSNSLSVSRNQLTVARLDTEHNNVIHMSQFPVEEDGVYKYPLKLIGISPTGLSFLEEIPQSTPVSSPAKSNELNKCRLGKKEGQRRPVRKKYKFKNRHTSSGLFKDIVSKKITSLNSINEINSEQSTLSETDDKDLFFFDLCGNISNWDLDKTCEGNSNNSCSEKNYQFSNERRNISNETQDIVRGSPVNRTNQKMISKKNYRAIESEQMKNTRKRNNSGDCILIFTSSDEDEQMKKNNCDTLFGKRKKRILDYKIQEKSLTDEMSTNSFSKPRKRRKNKNTLHNSSNSLEAEKLETTICIDTSESEIELSSTKKNRRHSSFANEYGEGSKKLQEKNQREKQTFHQPILLFSLALI
ncbi:hypothetical protein JTB14_013686 [Gonioctena quinquepunctata]|nr:hypothetical protein JTB14_013686 [Gonioctena quinquepunctata]